MCSTPAAGAAGVISAIDLAPENAAQVAVRTAAGEFLCPVEVRTGDVTALPYADAAFDAVWSANVTQYLPDAALCAMLCEARRVLKPGGRLALKETEDSAFRLHPLPPLLLWRLFDALAQAGEMTIIGGLRGLYLPQFVGQAGFVQVQCSVTTIERWAPLRPVETALVAELVAWLADKAETLALPDGDLAQWRTLADPAAPGYLLRQ
ncbi:MAG: methyltransferase domain-containing protein, partial [Burkholderiaceae bacterium]|nr:methyltransferase domain-containing protein [Burkholderiaceae bacterium]